MVVSPSNANGWRLDGPNLVVMGDSRDILPRLPDASITLIYLDPPFNTRRPQSRPHAQAPVSGSLFADLSVRPSDHWTDLLSYDDCFEDYWAFLGPCLLEAWRILADDGTLYLHLDQREAHYAKVMLDHVFGQECYLNEVIWAYDYGAKPNRRWPAKHDNILVYVKNPANYWFDNEAVERDPYMAPGRVSPERAAHGKLPTDVWWHTIVPTQGSEKTGWPTQKPEGVLRRIVQASSRLGDWVLDPFAGSGTTGAAAATLGRRFIVIDQHPEAFRIMQDRLGHCAEQVAWAHGE